MFDLLLISSLAIPSYMPSIPNLSSSPVTNDSPTNSKGLLLSLSPRHKDRVASRIPYLVCLTFVDYIPLYPFFPSPNSFFSPLLWVILIDHQATHNSQKSTARRRNIDPLYVIHLDTQSSSLPNWKTYAQPPKRRSKKTNNKYIAIFGYDRYQQQGASRGEGERLNCESCLWKYSPI